MQRYLLKGGLQQRCCSFRLLDVGPRQFPHQFAADNWATSTCIRTANHSHPQRCKIAQFFSSKFSVRFLLQWICVETLINFRWYDVSAMPSTIRGEFDNNNYYFFYTCFVIVIGRNRICRISPELAVMSPGRWWRHHKGRGLARWWWRASKNLQNKTKQNKKQLNVGLV